MDAAPATSDLPQWLPQLPPPAPLSLPPHPTGALVDNPWPPATVVALAIAALAAALAAAYVTTSRNSRRSALPSGLSMIRYYIIL